MIPTEIGLPAKFIAFRPGQEDAILDTAASYKRFTLSSIPTGGGKSLYVVGVARVLGGRWLFLTANKGLQQQYLGDMASIGMVDIRGQNNYKCIAVEKGGELEGFAAPSSMCDEGPCHVGVECSLRQQGCHYYDAVRRAANADLVMTNYSYWMTTGRYADPDSIGKFDGIVLDEAHAAPDLLADFCSIALDNDEVKSLIDRNLPPTNEGTEVWSEWAQDAYLRARDAYRETRLELERARTRPSTTVGGTSTVRRAAAHRLKRLIVLGRQLKELASAHKWRRSEPSDPAVWIPGNSTDWVTEKTTTGAIFSPVWAHAYAETYLFRQIPRVILTSATLQPAVAQYLGINPDVSEYKEFASTFPVQRRPFIWVPTTGLSKEAFQNEGQIRQWINRIDNMIELWAAGNNKPGQPRYLFNGIIHTRSYDRQALILSRSRFASKGVLLGHHRKNVRDIVEFFKSQPDSGYVLVSPAVEEGFDFPYGQCRFQIIAKVPFVDMRGPVFQARQRSDKKYQNYLTSQSLVQQVGRGMRAQDDWCVTIIIDDQMRWFWPAARKMKLFQEWFAKAYRIQPQLPTPQEWVPRSIHTKVHK